MKQLEAYLKKLGESYLPKGDKLEIVVMDIDMAGAFEPWRTPNLTRTRFIRDIYRPKFVLHYRWHTKDGAVKAEKDETVSDLNFLIRQETRKYQDSDPLRYEKTLLDRWFRGTFAATEKSIPQSSIKPIKRTLEKCVTSSVVNISVRPKAVNQVLYQSQ